MMRYDLLKYPGGTELRLLFTELDKELIRAAVMIAGVCLVFLIVYLI